MKDKALSLMASFFLLLIVTTLVLPGRQTPAVITSFFDLLSGASKTLLGTGPKSAVTANPSGAGGTFTPDSSDGGGGGGYGAH